MKNLKMMARWIAAISIIAAPAAGPWCARGFAADDAATASASNPPKLAPEVTNIFSRFVSEKRALAETIAKHQQLVIPPPVREFFDAAQKDDWISTSNQFFGFLGGGFRPLPERVPPLLWGAIHETFGTYELLEAWSPKFLIQFGTNTVAGIPAGSIYFGGSEAGRFLVSLFSDSHSEGRPFFTLTQNALSDPAYIGYLQEMYGQKIHLPATNDIQRCFEEYARDAEARSEHDKNFPFEPARVRRGEDFKLVNGSFQANGPVSVMAIHGLIIQDIFEKNPGRQFFLEESYPLEWTNPRLTPYQFVFKINRSILTEMPADAIGSDREFWTRKVDAWLGPWLTTNTSVTAIADFAKKTYLTLDGRDFQGDRQFVGDLEARKAFAHLRASIAGLYWWRATHAISATERERMTTEADFAFRQSFAICPSSDEVRIRYTELLTAGGRSAEARIVAEVAREFELKQSPSLQPMQPSSHTNDTQPAPPAK